MGPSCEGPYFLFLYLTLRTNEKFSFVNDSPPFPTTHKRNFSVYERLFIPQIAHKRRIFVYAQFDNAKLRKSPRLTNNQKVPQTQLLRLRNLFLINNSKITVSRTLPPLCLSALLRSAQRRCWRNQWMRRPAHVLRCSACCLLWRTWWSGRLL